MLQLVNQFSFLIRQRVRILSVDSGEIDVLDMVSFTIHFNSLILIVDGMQQSAVGHAPFRILGHQLSLKLELDYRDGLVHLGDQVFMLFREVAFVRQTWHKEVTTVIGVCLQCERCQGHEIDAVSILKRSQIVVTQRDSEYIGNAGFVPGCGTHPQGIVVAPLHVEILISVKFIKNLVRPLTAVEYIA